MKSLKSKEKLVELRFRPTDPFSHPVFGDTSSTPNLLLKVKCKRKKGSPNVSSVETDILGLIPETVRFRGMADFQYVSTNNKTDSNIEKEEEEVSETSLCLPPPVFSKVDIPLEYGYKANPLFKVSEVDVPSSLTKKKIVKKPKKYISPIVFMYINNPIVPSIPHQDANNSNTNRDNTEINLREMFEKRPMWSMAALKGNLNELEVKKLKKNLPKVAYYFKNGPWRKLWVKFGYDPRNIINSKMYLHLLASFFSFVNLFV